MGFLEDMKTQVGALERRIKVLKASIKEFESDGAGSSSTGKRTISAATRAKMAKAAKDRWAKKKGK